VLFLSALLVELLNGPLMALCGGFAVPVHGLTVVMSYATAVLGVKTRDERFSGAEVDADSVHGAKYLGDVNNDKREGEKKDLTEGFTQEQREAREGIFSLLVVIVGSLPI